MYVRFYSTTASLWQPHAPLSKYCQAVKQNHAFGKLGCLFLSTSPLPYLLKCAVVASLISVPVMQERPKAHGQRPIKALKDELISSSSGNGSTLP